MYSDKHLEIMRELFESGKLREIILFSENSENVKITMLKSKCFEIRQADKSRNHWAACFETSSTCEWEKVLNLAKSLIK